MTSWLLELVGRAVGVWCMLDSRGMKVTRFLAEVGMMVFLLSKVGKTVGAWYGFGVGPITDITLLGLVVLASLML